jgi:hypothetical protein
MYLFIGSTHKHEATDEAGPEAEPQEPSPAGQA